MTDAGDRASDRELEDAWLADAFRRFVTTRDAGLRTEIAERMSWLAVRSARRFWDKGEPFDDLVQVAQIGLLNAIDRYDPEHGAHFGAFATPTIIGELRRHFRDHTWSVHVPRRAKDLRSAVNAASEELLRELGRPAQVEEIAVRLHVPAEHVIEALDSNLAYRLHVLDPGAAKPSEGAASGFDDVLDHEVVAGLLQHLHPRERRIMTLRYFSGMSQAEIGAVIGASQVQVGRLIAASLTELRRHMGTDPSETG